MATTQASKNALTINPGKFDTIKKLGAFDVTACFTCGQCTVSCPLSESGNEFPRKFIRYAILGLEEKLLSQPEPWLCYYCGDCSTECPTQADPAGFMMAVRRHAIIEYSIGKVAKFFYSKTTALIAYLVLTVFAIAALWFFTHDSVVDLNTFNSYTYVHEEAIHIVGMILGLILFAIAAIQGLTMLRYLTKSSQTPPELTITKKLPLIISSLLTTGIFEGMFEKRFADCDSKIRYSAHLAIFWGFVLMGIATSIVFVVDLVIFYSLLGPDSASILDRDFFKLIGKILGVVGGVLLIYGTSYYIYKRLVKDDEYSQNSHFSDWILLLLSFFLGVTGFIMNIFIFLLPDLLIYAYLMYGLHIILAFILLITFAFTKLVHMEYRLLAIWYAEYQKKVKSLTET